MFDGAVEASTFGDPGESLEIPFDKPFQRADWYRLTVRAIGDNVTYRGPSLPTTIEIYEDLPPCRVGLTTNPIAAREYWELTTIINWRHDGPFSRKADAQRHHDNEVDITGCTSVGVEDGPEFGNWYVYWFQ